MDKVRVKEFRELVERIEGDMNSLLEGVVKIKPINLEEELETSKEFWGMVISKFQERILNRKDRDDNVFLEMEMLLAMKNEKAWALFSKRRDLLIVDYDTIIYGTLKDFENCQKDVVKQGFDKTFVDYYHVKHSQELECYCCHFQLENFAFAPDNVICLEPACKLKMKMEIKSIKYICCHEKLNQGLKDTNKKKGDQAILQS